MAECFKAAPGQSLALSLAYKTIYKSPTSWDFEHVSYLYHSDDKYIVNEIIYFYVLTFFPLGFIMAMIRTRKSCAQSDKKSADFNSG